MLLLLQQTASSSANAPDHHRRGGAAATAASAARPGPREWITAAERVLVAAAAASDLSSVRMRRRTWTDTCWVVRSSSRVALRSGLRLSSSFHAAERRKHNARAIYLRRRRGPFVFFFYTFVSCAHPLTAAHFKKVLCDSSRGVAWTGDPLRFHFAGWRPVF